MTTTAIASHPRRIDNAAGGEVLTFLETAAETSGARTYVDVELFAGNGTPLHIHDTFAETFEVLEGTLTIERDGETVHLGPGNVATAPIGAVHRFANDTDETVHFRCALEPASRGFEEIQQVVVGLVADGRTKGEMPRDPRHLAVMLDWSDTRLVGFAAAIRPVAALLRFIARRTGEDRRLRERYVRW